jgi:CRP-like cAMP-binding protein
MPMHDKLFHYFSAKTKLDRAAFDDFAHFFQLRKVKRKILLLRAGETCRYNYFVNAGCLRFYTLNEDAQESTRYFAFEGKFGTALSSLIEESPSFEFIEAVEHSEVLAINRRDFYHLVETVPAVNGIYRDILEMAYVTSQRRIYNLQGENALERLRWLMAYQPKILARLSSKVVASYLGVTPYTLSRLKREL